MWYDSHCLHPGSSRPDIINEPDSCGLDIYQSYFLCPGKCYAEWMDDNENDENNNNNKNDNDDENCNKNLIVCPRCYIDGRCCRCQYMEPRSMRPWNDLISVRNKGAAAVGRKSMELKC